MTIRVAYADVQLKSVLNYLMIIISVMWLLNRSLKSPFSSIFIFPEKRGEIGFYPKIDKCRKREKRGRSMGTRTPLPANRTPIMG